MMGCFNYNRIRFDDRVTGRLDKYAKQAKIIHLDIDPSEIDKNVKVTIGVWGDCKRNFTDAYICNRNKKTYRVGFEKFSALKKEEVDSVIYNELNPTPMNLRWAK